ncbi:MAG: fused MFS/spermidine synthase, partial [Pseudomonadota bacterium]
MKKTTWPILLILFYLSGASGLIYEIVWVRIFSLVFGNTNYAATIVLSAFFVGMAVGSLFFGRKSDRISLPFRVYAFLEIGIGLSALTVPILVKVMDSFYPSLYLALGEKNVFFFIIRFILSFIILFIPTFLMGGTLPLLIKFTSMLKEEFGESVSLLYALNTFGGVTGCFASGFFLVRYSGIYNTIYTGVVINVVVGLAALVLSKKFQAPEKIAPYSVEINSISESDLSASVAIISKSILVVAFVTGLLSISFEVVWARLLVYVLSSSVYAFFTMLTTFLFGIALGSLIAKWLIPKRKKIVQLCGVFLGATGIYGIVTIPLMVFLAKNDAAIMHFFGFSSWPSYNVGRFFQSAFILFVPTLLMGITFPLIASISKMRNQSGGIVIGNVYFINTLGAIIGSVITGFLLVPFIGCKWSIMLLSAIYILTGLTVIVFTFTNPIKKFGVITIALLILGISPVLLRGNPFIPLLNIREKGSEITYIKEGSTGTVTVHKYPSYKVINVNRVNVAGTSFVLRTTQKLQAFLPLFARRDPKFVCQIGFGSGETSSIVSRYESVERLDVVDISYEVFAAAPEFQEINHGLYNAPNIRKIVMDGKNYMHLTDETYDLIMNDSIHPVECGNASLYTKEYFEDCKKHLKAGGVMSSWFPLFALDTKDFKSLISTFNAVFPGCTLWVGNNCVNRHALLIGRKDGKDVAIDFDFLNSVLDKEWIRKELEEIRMYTVYDVLDSFMLNGKTIKAFVEGADLNTDFFPILEYRSPTTVATDNVLLAKNISDLLSLRSNVFYNLINITPSEVPEVTETLDRFMESTACIYRGHINSILENYRGVVPNYLKAIEVNPHDQDGKNLIEELTTREGMLAAKIETHGATSKELEELGILNIELGRTEKAKRVFETLLALEPHNKVIMYWLFDLYQTLEDKQKQREIIDKLIQVDDNNPEVFFQKGLSLGQEGNFESSLPYFKKA